MTKDKEEAAAIMATIDTDGGGEVEIHEFLAAVALFLGHHNKSKN